MLVCMVVPKIVIGERDALTALDIEECLTRMGCSAAAIAHSGREAIRVAPKVRPDLVLFDADVQRTLGGVDSELKLFDALNTPTVLMSDHSSPAARRLPCRTAASAGKLRSPLRVESSRPSGLTTEQPIHSDRAGGMLCIG